MLLVAAAAMSALAGCQAVQHDCGLYAGELRNGGLVLLVWPLISAD